MPARTRRRRRFRGGDPSSSSSSSNTRKSNYLGKLQSVVGRGAKNIEKVKENASKMMAAFKQLRDATTNLVGIARGTNDDNKKDAVNASHEANSQIDEAHKNVLKAQENALKAQEKIKTLAEKTHVAAASAAPEHATNLRAAAVQPGGAKRRRCKSCRHRGRKTCNHHRRKSCKQHRRKSCKRRGRSCKGHRRR